MILTAKPEIGTTKKEEDISSTVFFIFVTSNLRLGEPILRFFFYESWCFPSCPISIWSSCWSRFSLAQKTCSHGANTKRRVPNEIFVWNKAWQFLRGCYFTFFHLPDNSTLRYVDFAMQFSNLKFNVEWRGFSYQGVVLSKVHFVNHLDWHVVQKYHS